MGGPEALMMMIGMTAIKTGLKLTRWADATLLDDYTTDTTMWANASMVEVYGNFVLSTVAILTHVAAMVTEDPMFKEVFMVSVMLGHAVFMVSNLLRMVQLDTAFTVINDDASVSADVTDARAVVEGVKLDMAVSTAHEAMEMDGDYDKDMGDWDGEKDMGKSMGMMDKMMGGPEALMMMIGMTAIKTGLKLTRWADATLLDDYTTDTTMWANASMVEVYGNFVLSTVAILTHVAAMVTEDPMFKEAFMVSVMLGH